MNRQLAAIIERDGDRYAALCPQLDIYSAEWNIEK